jgi:hypothetical protein
MKALAYNVAALDKVLGLATKVGDSYKPGNASIERTALIALLEESRKSVTAVLKAEGDLATAINQRQEAFEKLPALGTQILNLAESCGMEPNHLQDLDRMRKHFRSQPFKGTALKTSSGGQALPAESFGRQTEQANGVSESSAETTVRKNRQLSYDNKVVTLESIIEFLQEHPSYNPTECEFTLAGLKNKLEDLNAHNQRIIDAKSELVDSRGKARKIIFDRKSGIFGKSRMVKKYLRTILGPDAELYKSVSKIRFKTIA